MKILVLGAGRMGVWLCDALCLDHEIGLYDPDIHKLKFVFRTRRFSELDEISEFKPELVINAVNLNKTIEAFEQVLPYLPKDCIISDIASVKNGLKDYYAKSKFKFVSTHPMFGPTFANVNHLSKHHAIIIEESDHMGKAFFKDFYGSLKLNIHTYTFEEHDRTTAYSLSTPFASTMVFAACMKQQDAPGTTFNKHLEIAKGLLSEDDYLLVEIMFNPFAKEQIESIRNKMNDLLDMIGARDSEKMKAFIGELRENIL